MPVKTTPRGSPENAQKIISRFKSKTAIADACEVTPQAVSDWLRHGMPKYREAQARDYLRLHKGDKND